MIFLGFSCLEVKVQEIEKAFVVKMKCLVCCLRGECVFTQLGSSTDQKYDLLENTSSQVHPFLACVYSIYMMSC